MICWYTLVIILLFSKLNIATLSIDVADDDFQSCGNGKPLLGVDFSQIQIISEDDGTTSVNGSIKVIKDFEDPIRCNLYSKKLERGTWIPGLISRYVPNLCSVLQMRHEPWYMITRHMNQKTCPFRAGHEELVNNVNIGNYADMLQVPPSFLGEWRLYINFATIRNDTHTEECLMIPMTISEV